MHNYHVLYPKARMAELCEKRRRRCERIDRKQAERREELLEQAREKARDREERLSALQQVSIMCSTSFDCIFF